MEEDGAEEVDGDDAEEENHVDALDRKLRDVLDWEREKEFCVLGQSFTSCKRLIVNGGIFNRGWRAGGGLHDAVCGMRTGNA